MSFFTSVKSFPRTFWLANTMELFERWAYYGMFAVLSVYLTDPVSKGGLGFSQEQRGIMQAVVTGILYLLPIIGGAIADRFGFRKVLLAAFVTLASGYFAMGQFHAYAPVFVAFLVVAVGGAIFKPVIVATVSKTTAKNSDTLGFGIFYMIVNVGGFIGPYAASKLRDIDWQLVFLMCAVVILINLVLLFFYKEPKTGDKKKKEPLSQAIKQILKNTAIVLKDTKFVLFLLIIVGFWTMYMQLFFTIPVYITQWIDTSVVYNRLGILKNLIGFIEDGTGIIRPEMMINVPALTIIIFQVIVSSILTNVKPVKSMIVGLIVVAVGMGQMAFYVSGWYILMGLVILAFGEMASSPRIQEYISRIAPKEKVALYMGYSFLPLAGGNLLGGLLSGKLYAEMSDKYAFLRDYLVREGIEKMDQITNIDDAVLFTRSMDKLNMSSGQLTDLLYQTYDPGSIFLIFGGIGIATSVLLILYNKFILSK
ncbi:MAG: MFS transporter [Bacteroidetes bacterium]|nr:MFS transporter [Bacteroidota bacterium]MBL7105018.1 MFS transporter [Bacteroidales bacterium]